MEREILCNLCGLTCALGQGRWRDNHGLIDASVCGEYESTPGNGWGALDDMTRHRFSLCEFCLDWLFSQFRIPVAVDDPSDDFLVREGETLMEAVEKRGRAKYGPSDPEPPWAPASVRVERDAWRVPKWIALFRAEKARRDAARAGLLPAAEG